jgi:hypothetical protein
VVLQQMNMTFVHVPTTEGFEMKEWSVNNVIKAMIAKENFITLGVVGTYYLIDLFLESTNSYYMMSVRWYVPCPDKYPRWNSFFRIFSV